MVEILNSIEHEQALFLMAPPGWGKTYKLLEAIKSIKRKCIFIFPLRALCDEVYLSALKKRIKVCNLRAQKDLDLNQIHHFDLILTTFECLNLQCVEVLSAEFVFILDEAHLIQSWGESFRPRLVELLEGVQTFSPPTILLSATVEEKCLLYFREKFEFHFKDFYTVDLGNLKLKNFPHKIYYYLNSKKWMLRDLDVRRDGKCSVVFCQYRSEVKELALKYKNKGFRVLSCVGGEASEFTIAINSIQKVDLILATSVLGHGVNLPRIARVYFLYKVKNKAFYLQMLGRGGRDGSHFELHTMNGNYFSKKMVFQGLIRVLVKSISNRVKYFLYYLNANRRNCSQENSL